MITLLCSAAGSPGVTTTSLGMVLHGTDRGLLVDADRDPSQAVLAGWLGGCQPRGRGIVPAIHERAGLGDLGRFTLSLDEREHHFLPGFATGANVAAFGSSWAQLARLLRAFSASGVDVVIDGGRVGALGLPAPLVEAADAVGLVCRSSLRSLAAARLAVPLLADASRAGLVLVGPGEPYSAQESADALELPLLGTLPTNQRVAAALSEGDEPPRRYDSSALVKAWAGLSASLRTEQEVAA